MKILVAGAGIAGSVLTRMLRERGHEVLLVDGTPQHAASRCAYAYTRLDWFRGPDRERARYALEWYDRHGWLKSSTGWVTDVRRGRDFTQKGHYLVHPRGPLLIRDLGWNLERYSEVSGGVIATNGTLAFEARHLVLACGAGMDRWYSGTPVYGGVFECRDYRMITPLKLLRITDRLTHVAADDGAVTRTAASKGRTPEEARQRSEKILNTMFDHGIVTCTRKWEYRAGVRWNSVDGVPVAGRISPHVWALTGFARNGYALAPSYARDLVRKLEEQ